MIYNAHGGDDAVKKFAETNVICLDATPFLPHFSAINLSQKALRS